MVNTPVTQSLFLLKHIMQSKYLLAVSATRLPLLPSALAIPAVVVMSRPVSSNVVSYCCVMRQLREVQRRNSVKGHFGYNLLQGKCLCSNTYNFFVTDFGEIRCGRPAHDAI